MTTWQLIKRDIQFGTELFLEALREACEGEDQFIEVDMAAYDSIVRDYHAAMKNPS